VERKTALEYSSGIKKIRKGLIEIKIEKYILKKDRKNLFVTVNESLFDSV
jgi:hypothetical protein